MARKGKYKRPKFSRKIIKKENEVKNVMIEPPEESSRASTPSTSASWSSTGSSSEKKMGNLIDYDLFDDSTKFDIVDIEAFGLFMSDKVVCKDCGGKISLKTTQRVGVTALIGLFCEKCTQKGYYRNSNMIKKDVGGKKAKMHELNLRLVYSFRAIGKGKAGAKLFCALMNLPHPPSRFATYEKALKEACYNVSKNSMEAAVREAVLENDNSSDIPVALDGTWQKRGHVSLNCVFTATSVDTGKVIDVAAYCKFCKCKNKKLHNKNCTANFQGTSGAMEAQGALDIFARSEEKFGVRYTHFLGDGDSKAFKTVKEKQIYGKHCQITKLECIGHVQKRMGSRLKALKQRSGKRLLSDGKSLQGKGRLTDSHVLKIQKYYGYAIRNNLESVDRMKKAIWAMFFHIGSSDKEPNHHLCPQGKDSWCKFWRAEADGESYNHNKHFHLPYPIMMEIKPIFQDLANPELLKKCLHGGTQNPNESFNNSIWTRVPKNTFVARNTLELGLYNAVACFNDGNIARCRVYQEIGIVPGEFCTEAPKRLDAERVKKSIKDTKQWAISARRKRSAAKKKLEEHFIDEESAAGPSYGPGQFSFKNYYAYV